MLATVLEGDVGPGHEILHRGGRKDFARLGEAGDAGADDHGDSRNLSGSELALAGVDACA
jgi:hypothetical protein